MDVNKIVKNGTGQTVCLFQMASTSARKNVHKPQKNGTGENSMLIQNDYNVIQNVNHAHE